jgi:hypothetical protein
MKIVKNDAIKISLILLIWYSIMTFVYNQKFYSVYESIRYFPFHLVITIGYYAVMSVCYKILFINDCEKEYDELIKEIDEGKQYFIKNNYKYI